MVREVETQTRCERRIRNGRVRTDEGEIRSVMLSKTCYGES